MCTKKTKDKVQLSRSLFLKMKEVEIKDVLLDRDFPLHFDNNLVDGKFFGDEPNKVWKALLLSPQATLGHSINDQMEIAWENIKNLIVIDLGTKEVILTQALESQVYGIVHDSSVYQEIKKLILERKGASTAFDLIFHFKREEHIVTKELAIFILKENVKLSLSTTKKTDA